MKLTDKVLIRSQGGSSTILSGIVAKQIGLRNGAIVSDKQFAAVCAHALNWKRTMYGTLRSN